MNTIEPSKSSRAKCRTCKNKIDKGVARLGVEVKFTMNGEEVTSKKWHHLSCGFETLPDAVLTAEIIPEVTSRGKPITISDDELEKIKEFKEKQNKSGMAVIGISEVADAGKTVNIEASVLRKMRARTMVDPNGKEQRGVTVYVEEEEHRSKIILWGEQSELELSPGDRIVVLGAQSELASNDNIQFNADDSATVLINPSDDEIAEHSDSISLYISDAWDRPTGTPAEFTYAPSGRASCGECGKKIVKGELKIVKPTYIELDSNRTVPGNVSYHLNCIIKDEDGKEVLHEAITRLTLDMISENQAELAALQTSLPESTAKDLLANLV